MPLPKFEILTYEQLGYNQYLEKTIDVTTTAGGESVLRRSLNFDHAQTTGSLGSAIQIGGSNIIIDGANKRIIINDGQNDRVLIGQGEF